MWASLPEGYISGGGITRWVVCAFVIVGDTGKLLSMEIIYTKLQQCITPRALINRVFLNFLIFANLIGKISISVAAVMVFTIFLL